LLEWLATDGQNAFVDGNHEYPVNPDVDPDELIASEFGVDVVRDEVNAGEVGRLNAEAVRLLDEAGYE
jgi:iron(III) transport system substrate-binding protein